MGRTYPLMAPVVTPLLTVNMKTEVLTGVSLPAQPFISSLPGSSWINFTKNVGNADYREHE